MSLTSDCAIALGALESFVQDAAGRRGPVIRQRPLADLAEELELARLIRDGGLHGEALHRFLGRYLGASTRLHHPGYMAHQVAVPHPMAAVAALVDAVLNNPMAIYEMGPAAATIEFVVVNWMLDKVGWQPAPLPGGPSTPSPLSAAGEQAGGVLTHGGSLANLTALMAARQRVVPDAWQTGTPRDLVVVAPVGCHYSIARAVDLFGLGRAALKPAPIDADGRIIPGQLRATVQGLQAQGRRVLAVVANACSTATGLYDKLGEIGPICRELGVWLHIDGAHGASALLSARHRDLLAGLALADSVVWDAHKMLRCPSLCAAVLVRDHRDLDGAFHDDASYLFHDKQQPGVDLIHRTVECTKAALGLKLFLVLAAEGEAGLAGYIDRQWGLAAEAARYLAAQPDVEVAVTPQANIVCFRLPGDDALQLKIRERLTADGRYYISTTEFRGRRWLRLALMNPDTTLDDVAAMLAQARADQAVLAATLG